MRGTICEHPSWETSRDRTGNAEVWPILWSYPSVLCSSGHQYIPCQWHTTGLAPVLGVMRQHRSRSPRCQSMSTRQSHLISCRQSNPCLETVVEATQTHSAGFPLAHRASRTRPRRRTTSETALKGQKGEGIDKLNTPLNVGYKPRHGLFGRQMGDPFEPAGLMSVNHLELSHSSKVVGDEHLGNIGRDPPRRAPPPPVYPGSSLEVSAEFVSVSSSAVFLCSLAHHTMGSGPQDTSPQTGDG